MTEAAKPIPPKKREVFHRLREDHSERRAFHFHELRRKNADGLSRYREESARFIREFGWYRGESLLRPLQDERRFFIFQREKRETQ